MAESFILRFPAPLAAAAEAEWLIVDASGARLGATRRGTLAAAAASLGGRRLVVLVPGVHVTLAAPQLPSKGAAKLLQLVPFALEEQLATDIEALHFATGKQGSDGVVPVAVLERDSFAGWLARLGDAGLAPAAVYPDSLLVPENPAHVVVLIEPDHVVIRRPGAPPLVLDSDPLDAAFAVGGLSPDGGDVAGAAHVLLYAVETDWLAHQPVVESLREHVASLRVQLLPEGALPLLSSAAVNAPPFNLLQGEFVSRQGFASEWPRWRLAASLAGAFLALHVATLGVDWWRLHREESRVDQELHAAAAEALPNIQNLSRLPSIRAAVESRLRASRAVVTEGLLGTFGVLATAISAAPGTLLESLSYRDGVTDLTVDAPDVSAVDRVQQAAKSRGFDAQLQGATQREQRYQGRLQLRGPGS
jgi:general secretion pathway protein L